MGVKPIFSFIQRTELEISCCTEQKQQRRCFSIKARFETKIVRHKKIKSEANPFDAEWKDYFEERMTYKMTQSLKGRKSLLYLWIKRIEFGPLCRRKDNC